MTSTGDRALDAAAGLREALTQVADALAAPSLDALLAGESAVEAALANLPSLAGLGANERARVRLELERARAALLRCRRLGAALTDFTRASLDAQGHAQEYGRDVLTARLSGRGLNARG